MHIWIFIFMRMYVYMYAIVPVYVATSIPISTKIHGTTYWKTQDLVSLKKYSLRFTNSAVRCL